MANELIINASLPETRIALMEDGEIQELLIERASGKGIVGNIYKGRVTRVLPGMQAAFVDIGLEKAAFLYVDDVYVHPEAWEDEEEGPASGGNLESQTAEGTEIPAAAVPQEPGLEPLPILKGSNEITEPQEPAQASSEVTEGVPEAFSKELDKNEIESSEEADLANDREEDEDDDEDDTIVEMGKDPNESDDSAESSAPPEGTVAPEQEHTKTLAETRAEAQAELSAASGEEGANAEGSDGDAQGGGRKRHRRGRRGGRFRRKGSDSQQQQQQTVAQYPENYHEQVAETGSLASDRAGLVDQATPVATEGKTEGEEGRPQQNPGESITERRPVVVTGDRPEFKAQRSRDRRIRQKTSNRPIRAQVNIQDLLKEGQEVLVQVAKDPIATKGARLTCHISLPGRHLVCMPTIDHVGVSRRIDREDERRRLREYVERNRPRNLGFIVRTASGKQQSEKRIKQDIDYLTRLWNEIKEKSAAVTAPSLVYEDLNAVLRAIRDWVTEEIDKVVVDSRYHYSEIQKFVSHFMPPLKQKVELYHGDIPIFDAYGISTELSRALERKVWLKSGGYIVVDQAEALVAIDVNTGRYVGKKNLEDTILKTNLEAVQEIAYQLRLRNCGGIIILDLIDMEKDENKQRVYRALEDALLRDRARPSILKISELGLIEMTRKRTRDTIVRSLCESCSHCEGKGFIKSKQTVAYEVMREVEREGIERDVSKILVQAHPDVIDILAIDERESLDTLERRYRKQIYLQAVTDFHPEQFEVSADKKERRDHHPSEREGKSDRHHDRHERSHDSHGDRHRHRDRDRDRDRNRTESSTGPQISPIVKTLVLTPQETSTAPVAVVQEGSSVEIGNMAPSIAPVVTVGPNGNVATSGTGSGTQAGDNFDEEDRLAFLRAQAAQDAALARLGSGAGSHSVRNNGEGSNRAPGNGGQNRRPARGRRGGKFRGRNDRGRNPKSFGYGPNIKRNENSGKEISTSSESNSSNSSGGDNSSGGNGNSGPAGGDHSQPPV